MWLFCRLQINSHRSLPLHDDSHITFINLLSFSVLGISFQIIAELLEEFITCLRQSNKGVPFDSRLPAFGVEPLKPGGNCFYYSSRQR